MESDRIEDQVVSTVPGVKLSAPFSSRYTAEDVARLEKQYRRLKTVQTSDSKSEQDEASDNNQATDSSLLSFDRNSSTGSSSTCTTEGSQSCFDEDSYSKVSHRSDDDEYEEDESNEPDIAEEEPQLKPDAKLEGDAPEKKGKGNIHVVQSLFGRPPTIYFPPPSNCATENQQQSETGTNLEVTPLKDTAFRIKYRLTWERNCLKDCFNPAGLYRTSGKDWNLLWGKHLTPAKEYSRFHALQRYNHFPCAGAVGRKDSLGNLIHRFKRVNGIAYNFHPECFILPGQRDLLHSAIKREPRWLWIRKPLASSQGRGIRVLSGEGALGIRKNRKCVVQRYIERPHLINNRKYDIRMYILVASYQPLRIYMYPEGFARFCTVDYSRARSSGKLSNSFGHLTNTSINKHHGEYVVNDSVAHDAVGSKWSLTALFRELSKKQGTNTERIRRSMNDIAVKTIIASDSAIGTAVRQHVKSSDTCFELFGFDFILDESLKVWLVEVNISPSLMTPSPLDKVLKSNVVRNVLNIVGVQPRNIAKLRRQDRKNRKDRLQNGSSYRHPKKPHEINVESPNSVTISTLPPKCSINNGVTHRRLKPARSSSSLQSTRKLPKSRSIRSGPSFVSPHHQKHKKSAMKYQHSRPLSGRRISALADLEWGSLSPQDQDVVFKTYDENRRRGQFVRVFPPQDPKLHAKYMGYFQSQRYENVLVQKFERQIPTLYNLPVEEESFE